MSADINDRIVELIRSVGLTQNAFATALNTSSARISNIVRKRNKPDSDLLAVILSTYPHINARWLLTGSGNMTDEKDGSVSPTGKNYPPAKRPGKDLALEDPETYVTLQRKVKELTEENEKLKIKNEAYLDALTRLGGKQ